MTVSAMSRFGVNVSWQDENSLYIPGGQSYTGAELSVEGDYSNAAFFEALNVLGGNICINEAFIVDNKKKRKICMFIKGYCTGVSEVLLNSSEVDLVCTQCPLNSKFKTQCVMEIKTK